MLECRKWLLKESLKRAQKRLLQERYNLSEHTLPQVKADRQREYNRIRAYQQYASQIGASRPIASCSFSQDSAMLATSSWSGECKIWSIPECTPLYDLTIPGSKNDRITSIAFHPTTNLETLQSAQTTGTSEQAVHVAAAGADSNIYLWSLLHDSNNNHNANERLYVDDGYCSGSDGASQVRTPIAILNGHSAHVSRIAFHPAGRHIGSASYDYSWRLWDIERRVELLLQEGHSKPVHCLSFQCDGSLAATGGLDACGRVWDLRTGKCIMPLTGHIKSILGIDFSPSGYEIATGSEDHTIRVWDLRKQACIRTIPAHLNLVSQVKYNATGSMLVSAGYDNLVHVWGAYDGRLLGTFFSA